MKRESLKELAPHQMRPETRNQMSLLKRVKTSKRIHQNQPSRNLPFRTKWQHTSIRTMKNLSSSMKHRANTKTLLIDILQVDHPK